MLCSVPELYQSTDWALVSAQPAQGLNTYNNNRLSLSHKTIIVKRNVQIIKKNILLDEISITGIHLNVNYTFNYKLLISTSDV